MFTANKYIRVKSLEEAYELNQKKNNRLVGGMLWLKMSKFNINNLIDISELGLNKIEENENEFIIGCMTTLRDLEINESLNKYTKNSIKESLKNIVGIQFRNSATIGGSIYGRYGFSDVLTMFLSLDTYVELYKGGIVSLKDFINMKPDRDIIVRIILKKKNLDCVYISQRNSKTDFPIIAVCVAKYYDKFKISVGARPAKARVMEFDINKSNEYIISFISNNFEFNSNMRASADYRKYITNVFIRRALVSLRGE